MDFLKTWYKLPYCFLERFVIGGFILMDSVIIRHHQLKTHFHTKANQENQNIYVD